MKLQINLLFLLLFCGLSVQSQTITLVEAPAAVEGNVEFTNSFDSDWGADLTAISAEGTAVLALDGTAEDSLNCFTVINTAQVAGKIAFVYRGGCNFSEKAYNVQVAGAVACVIVNNTSGVQAMAPGINAELVNIPVVMISMEDGEALRPYLDNGTLEMFIGDKTGRFTNDLGYYKQHATSAINFATPHVMALDSTDFKVLVSSWVYNYGTQTQSNVVLNATVDRDALEIYNETSSGYTIAPGDSVFIELPDHGSMNQQMGYYTLNYSVSSDQTEDFEADNELNFNWWINERQYSKSGFDSQNYQPNGFVGIRPSNASYWSWCTTMESANASATKVTGLTFATTANANETTLGEELDIEFYAWNDPFGSFSISDLDLLGSATYTYDAELSGEFVTAYFDQAITLNDNQRYLSCISFPYNQLFMVTDNDLDYTANYAYPVEAFFPIYLDGTWYTGGFGAEDVPTIITETCTETFTASANATACESYQWNNNTYTQTGEYDHHAISANGCDSVITLDLTINPTFGENLFFDLCEGESVVVGAQTYTTGGNFVQNLNSTESCDSTVNISITMYDQPTVNILGNIAISAFTTETYAAVQVPGYTMTWSVVNGTILSGQSTSSIDVFWDNNGLGSVTLAITNNICTYEYVLEVGVPTGIQESLAEQMKVYPNPSNDIFNLVLPMNFEVELFDAMGKLILVEQSENGTLKLSLLNQPSGVYTAKVYTQNSSFPVILLKD